MRKQNWDDIEERQSGSFEHPDPGGYVAVVRRVIDCEGKEYLDIWWDFAEGRWQGSNEETFDRAGFWPTRLIRSYKPRALPFFKSFKSALEASNRGYRFREEALDDMVGKRFGVVLGEEQYMGNDGSLKTRLYVSQTRSLQAIREGEYTIPSLKPLKERPAAPAPAQSAAWNALTEDDGELPF